MKQKIIAASLLGALMLTGCSTAETTLESSSDTTQAILVPSDSVVTTESSESETSETSQGSSGYAAGGLSLSSYLCRFRVFGKDMDILIRKQAILISKKNHLTCLL